MTNAVYRLLTFLRARFYYTISIFMLLTKPNRRTRDRLKICGPEKNYDDLVFIL